MCFKEWTTQNIIPIKVIYHNGRKNIKIQTLHDKGRLNKWNQFHRKLHEWILQIEKKNISLEGQNERKNHARIILNSRRRE